MVMPKLKKATRYQTLGKPGRKPNVKAAFQEAIKIRWWWAIMRGNIMMLKRIAMSM